MSAHDQGTTRTSNWRHLSLQLKVILIMLAIVVLQGGIGFYSTTKVVDDSSVSQEQLLEDARRGFSGTLAALLFERYGDVQAFSVNPVFLEDDKLAITEALDRYVSLYGIYQAMVFVDPQGRLIAANSKQPDGKLLDTSKWGETSFPDAPWFRNAVEGRFLDDKAKRISGTYVSEVGGDPVISSATGSEFYGIQFSTPVRDASGELMGILSTHSDFAWVEAEATAAGKVLAANRLASSMISIVDRAGRVILDVDLAHGGGKRDLEVVGKLDAKAAGSESVRRTLAGESGSGLSRHAREGIEVFSSFGPLASPKVADGLGWHVLVEAEPKEVYALAHKAKRDFYVSFAGVVALCLAIGFLATRAIARNFIAVSDKLRDSAEKTAEVARELTQSARESAGSITSQAAAVQETVASMSEMTSMIAQASENAQESLALSKSATGRAEDGNRIMQRLVDSMESIQQANGQLQNISNIISEIAAKTAVINDIVFKTQLLSFNASIEAARAGQHGRGFAVVAAEVGNLAQLSGTAAKEIQLLLDDSKRQVEGFLEGNQQRVQEGQAVSSEALATFSDIARTISSIGEQIRGITDATTEQEIGVKQTGIAMGQMDSLSQRNSIVAQHVSTSAGDLEEQSLKLQRIMQATRILVLGSRAQKRAARKLDVIDDIIGDSDSKSIDSRGDSRRDGKNKTQEKAPNPKVTGRDPALLERLKSRMSGSSQAAAESASTPVAKRPLDAKPSAEDALDGVSADDDTFRAA
jgi:methyl-accepting chemotaxis protein